VPANDPDRTAVPPGGAGATTLLVRAGWFLFVGWWLTGLWLSVAWFLIVTVVGAPLGVAMISRVPFVLSLKRRRISNEMVTQAGEPRLQSSTADQLPLLVRAVYFVLIGWWASLLWMGPAYLFTLSIVGLPVAIWLYGKLPFVASLYRY